MECPEAFLNYLTETLQFHGMNDDDEDDDDNYSLDSSFRDDDSLYDFSDEDSNESSNELSPAEKAFVCDYDKIFVCLYDEVEEYRLATQSKKKNTSNTWNNLLVILPSGKTVNLESAPGMIFKNNKKPLPNEKSKIENGLKQKSTNKQNDFSNNNPDAEASNIKAKQKSTNKQNGVPATINFPETKVQNIKLTKENKPEKMSKKKLKKQRQKEKRDKEKKEKEPKEEIEENSIKEEKKIVQNGKISPESVNHEKSGKSTPTVSSRASPVEVAKSSSVQVSKASSVQMPKASSAQASKASSAQAPKASSAEVLKPPHVEVSKTIPKVEKTECTQDLKIDMETDENDELAADTELLDEMPAFMSNALKKQEKKTLIKKEEKAAKIAKAAKSQKIVKPATKPTLNNTTLVQPVASNTSGKVFNSTDATIKKNQPKSTGNEYKEAIVLGKKSLEFLFNNNISEAVQFLSEAIHLTSQDLRHFLNRSFCYLRLGAYNLALKDAQHVIKITQENDQLVKAKLRVGLAFSGLQNYKEAEKHLDEAYNFSQADPLIHRELLRVKILQLLSMGFHEKDIFEVFQDYDSVEEIVAVLTEKTLTEDEDDYIDVCDEDDIYNSDDEDNPCYTRMLSNLLNKKQGFVTKHNFASALNSSFTQQEPKIKPSSSKQKIITAVPTKVPYSKDVNNRAIWVGNTTPDITEAILKKQFTKFGKIISIYKRPNENYSFINFENANSVATLLNNQSVVQFDGHKLPIKAATRTK